MAESTIRKITVTNGQVDATNSTSTPLAGGGVYTGSAVDVSQSGIVYVSVHSDVASATDGLSVQQSTDGTNWDFSDDFSIAASSGKNFSINPHAQYLRVVYTNGVTIQGVFRLQTVLKLDGKSSTHRIQDILVEDDDAELVKAVLSAKVATDGFVNIQATESENLRVANAEDGLSIAKGAVVGTTFIHKFGAALDFDVGDGFVSIWDGAEDNTAWENMTYTYSTSADIDTISSDDNGDTQDLEIQGLDTNYDLVTQTITLTGQTPASLTTNLIRVFRLKNVNSTDNAGHVFCYVGTDGATNGVPDTADDVRAVIHPGNNQTLMAIFTIPNGKTGYMRDWYASTAGAKRDSQHSIKLLARPFGQVFQLKHLSNISVTGTSYIQHKYDDPEVFSAKTDIEMRADTDQDIAGVAAGFDIVLVDD